MSLYANLDAHVGVHTIPPKPPHQVSRRGEALIHRFEGFRGQAYLCPARVWTIGYGNTRWEDGHPVIKGDTISRERAGSLFQTVLRGFTRSVLQAVEVPLTQGQLDALVSLAYNIGKNAFRRSTLLRELNAGNYEAAREQFHAWRRGGGVVLPGLVRRRAAEAALFNS